MKWFKVGGDNVSGIPNDRRKKGRVETGKRLLVAGVALGLLAAVLGTSTAAANLPGMKPLRVVTATSSSTLRGTPTGRTSLV
jgi:hypothetical protein